LALLLELGPLDDAEAVLLVDDHQAQPAERDVLGDERVGADDELGEARLEADDELGEARLEGPLRLRPLGGGEPPDEQQHPHAQGLEERAQALEVLPG